LFVCTFNTATIIGVSPDSIERLNDSGVRHAGAAADAERCEYIKQLCGRYSIGMRFNERVPSVLDAQVRGAMVGVRRISLFLRSGSVSRSAAGSPAG
jgi:hypothetical protein